MIRRHRRIVLAATIVLASLGLAACGDGSSVSGQAHRDVRQGPTIASSIDAALFTVDCALSHRAPDDPIVYPGEPGASHMHDFFGAEETDASSTPESLRAGPTTCEDRADSASYWVPTLYDGTNPVEPRRLRAYYRATVGADVTEVQPPPFGLEMIVGDMHQAAGDWPDTDRVAWGCGQRPKTVVGAPPDNCTVNSPVTLRLVFPDCWNGRDLKSPDHRAHVAFSDNGRCPASHPVPILQIQLSIEYPVWKPTPGASSPVASTLRLASGRFEGSHGDFFNAWDPDRIADHTNLCVRAMANCTIG